MASNRNTDRETLCLNKHISFLITEYCQNNLLSIIFLTWIWIESKGMLIKGWEREFSMEKLESIERDILWEFHPNESKLEGTRREACNAVRGL